MNLVGATIAELRENYRKQADDLVTVAPFDDKLWLFGSISRHLMIVNEDGTVTEIHEEITMPKKKKRLTKDQKVIQRYEEEMQKLAQEIINLRASNHSLSNRIICLEGQVKQHDKAYEKLLQEFNSYGGKVTDALCLIRRIAPYDCNSNALQREIGAVEGLLASATGLVLVDRPNSKLDNAKCETVGMGYGR